MKFMKDLRWGEEGMALNDDIDVRIYFRELWGVANQRWKFNAEKKIWTFIRAIYRGTIDLWLISVSPETDVWPVRNDEGNRSGYRFFFSLFYFIVFFWVSCCLAITVIIFAVKFMSIFFIPYSMGSISVRYLFMTIFSFPMFVTFLLGRFEITSAPEQDRYPDRCTCLFIFFFFTVLPFSQFPKFFHRISGCDLLRVDIFRCWWWCEVNPSTPAESAGLRFLNVTRSNIRPQMQNQTEVWTPSFFLGGNQSQKLV